MDQTALERWSKRLTSWSMTRWRWLERLALAPFRVLSWLYEALFLVCILTLLVGAVTWLLSDPLQRAEIGLGMWTVVLALGPVLLEYGGTIVKMWAIRQARRLAYRCLVESRLEQIREELGSDRVKASDLMALLDPEHPPSREEAGAYAIFIRLKLALIVDDGMLPEGVRAETAAFLDEMGTRFTRGRPHANKRRKAVYGFTLDDAWRLATFMDRYEAWLDTHVDYRGTRWRIASDDPAVAVAEEDTWSALMRDLLRFRG